MTDERINNLKTALRDSLATIEQSGLTAQQLKDLWWDICRAFRAAIHAGNEPETTRD